MTSFSTPKSLTRHLILMEVLMKPAIKAAEKNVQESYVGQSNVEFLALMHQELEQIATEASTILGEYIEPSQIMTLCSGPTPGTSRARWQKLLATLAAVRSLRSQYRAKDSLR